MHNEKTLYYYLSRYRSQIMGLALLWVIWFHSSVRLDFFDVTLLNRGFNFLKTIGYIGVDIFLFVSGMGIYNSLCKNNLSDYIRNRVKRIAPIWWTYMIFWFGIGAMFFKETFSKLEVMGFATFTGFWINMKNQANWYVYFVMFLYLISPIIFSIIKESKNKTCAGFGLVLLSFIISLAFMGNVKLMAFSRIPIYIIGMYVSANLKEFKMNAKKWLVTIGVFFAGLAMICIFYKYFKPYLWYGLWWYPCIILCPALTLLLAKFFDITEKFLKPLLKILASFGKYSLEILLVSDYFFANFRKLKLVIVSPRITAVVVVLLSIVFGYLFHYLVNFLTKSFYKLKDKAKTAINEKVAFIGRKTEADSLQTEEAAAVVIPSEETAETVTALKE